MLEHQRGFLANLQFGQVVIPYLPRGTALGEEQQISFHACARRLEHTSRQAHNTPQVAIIEQFPLGLNKRIFIRAEKQAFVQDDAAAAAISEAADDVLEKQYLRGAGLVVKVCLGLLAFFPTKGWIGEDDIESLWRALEQPAVALPPGQRVAVPEVRLVDAVQDQVRQGDWIDQ